MHLSRWYIYMLSQNRGKDACLWHTTIVPSEMQVQIKGNKLKKL